MERLAFSILIFIAHLAAILALTGYDCTVPTLKITTYANTDVAPCRPPVVQTQQRESVKVQVIQRLTNIEMAAMRCKLVIMQRITHCGMHSHSSEMPNSITQKIHKFTPHECQLLIQTNQFDYPDKKNHTLKDLKPNHMNYGNVLVAGRIENNGYCKGVTYDDKDDVIVMHTYTLFYSAFMAEFDTEKTIVHLGPVRCPMVPPYCHDAEHGSYFWSHQRVAACDYSYYRVLYAGDATLVTMIDAVTDHRYKVLTVRHHAYLYSLLITGKITPCMHELSVTDQTNVYVSFHAGLFPRHHVSVNASLLVNPFAFFNTKIFYVANHVAEQLENLYRDILFHTCQQEKSI